MARWFIRYGSPRNRFQALMCWLCGFDVYFGDIPPWTREPEVKPAAKVAEPQEELPPPPVKRLTPRARQSSV